VPSPQWFAKDMMPENVLSNSGTSPMFQAKHWKSVLKQQNSPQKALVFYSADCHSPPLLNFNCSTWMFALMHVSS
jgi:hypothetical protein